MKIVGFAFKKNVSSEVLQKLKLKRKYFVTSEYEVIRNFVTKLVKEKPDYVLGLGMYSRKDKDKLRIETQCRQNGKKLEINNFLTPGKLTKLANGIGNSYCNYVSVLIMDALDKKILNAKYTFIHIPNNFQVDRATEEIKEMLLKVET